MTDRHSKADEPQIVVDPAERAKLEARNALEQFGAVITLVEQFTATEHPPFRLRSSTILQLHRIALDGLSAYAGVFRPAGVDIGGSAHKPVAAYLFPMRIEEMCEYVTDNWSRPAIHLTAYALWRLNWIHPFTDGNGRTARAVAYCCCASDSAIDCLEPQPFRSSSLLTRSRTTQLSKLPTLATCQSWRIYSLHCSQSSCMTFIGLLPKAMAKASRTIARFIDARVVKEGSEQAAQSPPESARRFLSRTSAASCCGRCRRRRTERRGCTRRRRQRHRGPARRCRCRR
jgi:fido (protein-threonine AMPylation protein)